MHHLPCEMVSEPSSKPSATFDGCEQNNVEYGEESGKIAFGSNPKLYVAHALKRALYLCHSGNETNHCEHRHRLAMHCDNIAHAKNDGRAAKQLLVGEAKLHAEKQWKIHSHTRKSGIKQEKYVLNHEVGGAANAIKRAEVHTSAELKAKGGKHIHPRLGTARNPPFHHRHGKALIWGRTAGTLHKKFC